MEAIRTEENLIGELHFDAAREDTQLIVLPTAMVRTWRMGCFLSASSLSPSRAPTSATQVWSA